MSCNLLEESTLDTSSSHLSHHCESADILNTARVFDDTWDINESLSGSNSEEIRLEISETPSPVFSKTPRVYFRDKMECSRSQPNEEKAHKTDNLHLNQSKKCSRKTSVRYEKLECFRNGNISTETETIVSKRSLLHKSPSHRSRKRRKLHMCDSSRESPCKKSKSSYLERASSSSVNSLRITAEHSGFVPASALISKATSSDIQYETERSPLSYRYSWSPENSKNCTTILNHAFSPVFGKPELPQCIEPDLNARPKSKKVYASHKPKPHTPLSLGDNLSPSSSTQSSGVSFICTSVQSSPGPGLRAEIDLTCLSGQTKVKTATPEPPIVVLEDEEDVVIIEDEANDLAIRAAQIEDDEAFARQLQAQFDMESVQHHAASPATRRIPQASSNPPEYCGIPGCGGYEAMIAPRDFGYCGRPGCSGNLANTSLLSPTMLDPHILQFRSILMNGGRSLPSSRRTHGRRVRTQDLFDDRNGNNYEALLAFEERQGPVVGRRRLCAREINRLPTKQFDPDCAAGKTQCHICFCDYSKGEKLRILPCLHDYHSKCIDRWLKESLSCPICRVDVEIE
ncbi:uncharacterized protein SI:CH211-59O9.10 [Latimeria chalumnae]|uniref:uncharacterized protein SI:CH211-59O9.10 n=1 Tax=Latimeria chalumnae TaxID=7897 RepID=UPI0006D8DD26|nr:PREDICTED: uncharacterized protein LOC102351833 [Latimeria chalumnae]|eukprot:XP_014341769.1 PREDICTED: uncharacterized protein LOC102351833 [Latimeria chalumnae]